MILRYLKRLAVAAAALFVVYGLSLIFGAHWEPRMFFAGFGLGCALCVLVMYNRSNLAKYERTQAELTAALQALDSERGWNGARPVMEGSRHPQHFLDRN